MANEISITAQLQYTNPIAGIGQKLLSLINGLFTISGKNFEQGSVTVPTSATAMPLGSLASIGWFLAINHDPTNYVTVLTGTAGTAFCRLQPGESILMRWDPTVSAPAWQSHTATCVVEFLLLES